MVEIDMQMPEKCGLCPCFHHENPMYCQAVKADTNKKIVNPYGSQRPEWCPLKEQEAKPIAYTDNPYTGLPVARCPNCGKFARQFDMAHSDEETHFCPWCGQAVKWE